ncbi:MAG: peptidoglycan editing factor PgeF [Glaciecola sp.]
MLVFEPSTSLFSNLVCFTSSTSLDVGNSVGNFAGLNLGAHVGDKLEHVEANRNILRNYLLHQTSNHTAASFKWLNQQHTTAIYDYKDYTNSGKTNAAPCDGMVVQQPHVPLVIMTADCMPVVLFCHETSTLVCVHAGWRGLVDGILENALSRFDNPNQVRVWIGPSISAPFFEVGDDTIDQFSSYERSIVSLPNGKHQIDLAEIANLKLSKLGVCKVEVSPICTYDNPQCYSHRRSQHMGLSSTGRLATVAMITL